LGRSKAAPTVGLSKIRCFNDQIIFQITCVYLYYRRRGDESKKKMGESGEKRKERGTSRKQNNLQSLGGALHFLDNALFLWCFLVHSFHQFIN